MSSEAIRPSTMVGIKRLAKSIKNARGIQHHLALEAAAQSAGFQNFKHASNVLKDVIENQHARPRHQLFLAVYWRDRKLGENGRETLTFWLNTVWSDLITSAQLKNHYALVHFHPEGPDHLAQRYLVNSQSQARRSICAAARMLQFMDATKLRPSKSHSRAYPGGRSSNAVPGRDHSSIWYDRDTKRYLFVDEPYEKAAQSKAAERTAWSQRHGFAIAQPSWPGIYNPDGGSRLYLIADTEKGIPLEPIIAALERMPEPIVEATWNGESAPMTPIFISPGTIDRTNTVVAEATPKKPGRTAKGPRNTIGYVQTFAGPRRRPKGKMPIEAHAKTGELLKSVLVVSRHRKGVYNQLNWIRSELDEWVQREYNHIELPSEQFFDLYYHESGSTFSHSLSADERLRHIDSLKNVKEILIQYYPDSSPLRVLLKNSIVRSTQCKTGGYVSRNKGS